MGKLAPRHVKTNRYGNSKKGLMMTRELSDPHFDVLQRTNFLSTFLPFHRKVYLQIQRAKASFFLICQQTGKLERCNFSKLVKIGTKTREYIRGDSFLPRTYVLEHTPGQSRKRRNEGKDKKDTKDRTKIAGRK